MDCTPPIVLVFALVLLWPILWVSRRMAPISVPLQITSAEYQFDAAVDSQVLADRQTELWARVYMPSDFSFAPYPVILILHGNDETCGYGSNPRIDENCQYTTAGTCPAGYDMAPSYLGYGYLANRLASWGYVVVSINANRRITCGAGITFDDGLNLARGRLVLRHLALLSGWNQFGETPGSLGVELQGALDFSSVGLLGHSRGGEGMRAAYSLYRDPGSRWPSRIPDGVNFGAIFEIGPVDGQTYRTLNADGTVWRYDPLNEPVLGNTSFSIQLATADGNLSSPVLLSSYASLTGPVGNANQIRHPILQTVRIPLSDFPDANLTQIRGVRLTFDDTPTGVIYVANIRLSALSGSGTPPSFGIAPYPMMSASTRPASSAPASASSGISARVSSSMRAASSSLAGSIHVQPASSGAPSSMQSMSSVSASSADSSEVDLVVRANGRNFNVGDALPIIEVGDQKLTVSRYGDGGDTSILIFRTAGAPRGRATLWNGKETYSLGGL